MQRGPPSIEERKRSVADLTQTDIRKILAKIEQSKGQDETLRALNANCQELFEKLKPTTDEVHLVTLVFQEIAALIGDCLKQMGITEYSLQPYGSSVNGLALSKDESDLDLSLIITDRDGDFLEMEHFDQVFKALEETLRAQMFFNEYAKKEISRYRASVHSASFGKILNITDVKHNYKIDISPNKVADLYNSHLLRTYALLDERFHMMALLVKSWNKRHFPDKHLRLNSYSLVLMIVAYLQHEKILPRL